MLVGLLSVGAELVAIIACTVAINKLSEIKRAVTSRAAQTTSDSPATHVSCILVRLASLQPTAGVAKLLTSEPTMALWWLTANVNFFAGLVGLCGMTGVRGFLAFGGCGFCWGGAGGCVAASAALLMTSLINTAIASGDGSEAEAANVFGLLLKYNALLLQRAATAPLTAASLLCALGGSLFALAGIRSTLLF